MAAAFCNLFKIMHIGSENSFIFNAFYDVFDRVRVSCTSNIITFTIEGFPKFIWKIRDVVREEEIAFFRYLYAMNIDARIFVNRLLKNRTKTRIFQYGFMRKAEKKVLCFFDILIRTAIK